LYGNGDGDVYEANTKHPHTQSAKKREFNRKLTENRHATIASEREPSGHTMDALKEIEMSMTLLLIIR